MRLEDLMERAAKYDETLARDIKEYIHGRKCGLIYEASKPEFVRMWKKPVARGDMVNILPPRGVMENTNRDDDPAEEVYRVVSIADGTAKLRNEKTEEEAESSTDNLVAVARFDKPIYAGLREVDRIERGGDKPYHVVINGENFHALQTLVYAYQGKVDCIYIDPPYNTGAKDWKYNNNYVGKDDKYPHSKWLTFMEDRLILADKLLNKKNSVLIVTIDEKEYLRLGMLLERVFSDARISMTTIVMNPGGVKRVKDFSRSCEYAFFVMYGSANPIALPLGFSEWMGNKKTTTLADLYWRPLRRTGAGNLRKDSPGCFYPVYVSKTNLRIVDVGNALPLEMNRYNVPDRKDCYTIFPLHVDGRESRWQMTPENLKRINSKGYVRVRKNNGKVTIYYISDGEQKKVENGVYKVVGYDESGAIITEQEETYCPKFIPTNVWNISSHNSDSYGSRINKLLLPDRQFPYPKSLYAVEDCIRFFVADKPNALILDFFAGSGTTAHATMLLNHLDNGRRRCISITNNEVSAEEEKAFTKQGLRHGDDEWEEKGIARYITWPRVRTAITGINTLGEPIKSDYKFTEEFPMSDGFEENAVFFDLEYLEPSVVGADLAFESIAPILWLFGGCKGEILTRHKGYVIGETYAILFDPRYTKRFVDAVRDNQEIKTVFIVTDYEERYQSLCAKIPGRDVKQLYKSYLRSFEVNALG